MTALSPAMRHIASLIGSYAVMSLLGFTLTALGS